MNGVLRSRGVTLPELLLVLAILGVVAAAAIPALHSGDPQALDLAAEEVASAMRFARSEAMRTGEPHGYHSQGTSMKSEVFRLNTAASPWEPIFDVYHPVSKQLYDTRLKDHPYAAVDSMTHNWVYRGTCDKPREVYFDTTGTPWCRTPENVLLEQYDVILAKGGHTRVITLHGVTGQVTIQ